MPTHGFPSEVVLIPLITPPAARTHCSCSKFDDRSLAGPISLLNSAVRLSTTSKKSSCLKPEYLLEVRRASVIQSHSTQY